MDKKILFIGGGQMAEGIISGLIRQGVFAPDHIFVSDVVPQRLIHLKTTYSIIPTDDPTQAASCADVIFLAVRPQDVASACAGLENIMSERRDILLASIVAGVDLAALTAYTAPGQKIVRIMPNTLIQAQNGFSAACVNTHVNADDRQLIQTMLEALGQVMFLSEAKYDLFTAYSCVGPMYIYLMMHALIQAGVRTGFSREESYAITIKNTLGAAQMLELTGDHPLQRIDTMTSPGGVTIDALASLEEDAFVGTILKSMKASVDKTLSFK
ncbi:MAG: pyrroline-5-carboxylate reductase [Eubacteriales bacterium]|jgi:pyrroline-5-carboxylate reductase|nr:pyrroline-5-carboxylate reductase [Eubacteriales bacterium]MDD3289655.1 pyrroline-5-carboxylate reductase [Eubacteriales bacterium]MDD3863740.1 pyrroline-5-carboxylate reductase [Eubacteriales bacterium]